MFDTILDLGFCPSWGMVGQSQIAPLQRQCPQQTKRWTPSKGCSWQRWEHRADCNMTCVCCKYAFMFKANVAKLIKVVMISHDRTIPVAILACVANYWCHTVAPKHAPENWGFTNYSQTSGKFTNMHAMWRYVEECRVKSLKNIRKRIFKWLTCSTPNHSHLDNRNSPKLRTKQRLHASPQFGN